MYVTAEMLVKKGATCSQVQTFRDEWPEGIQVTLEAVRRAQDLELDLDWFACEFFTATAWQAYEEATATAWQAYKEATATARQAYEEAKAPAWQAYAEATATAFVSAVAMMERE